MKPGNNNRIYSFAMIVLLLLFETGCKQKKFGESGTVTDVNGNVYKTITIGAQTWMQENLKATKLNDGTALPTIILDTTWSKLNSPAYCWSQNDSITNKKTYGALYNWFAVNTGKLCPTGWHVPSDAEWTTLTDYLGGLNKAGSSLKSSTGWTGNELVKATNSSGFTALPGSLRSVSGTFRDIGGHGFWWTSTETEADMKSAWMRRLNNCSSSAYSNGYPKVCGFSVRCVKDN